MVRKRAFVSWERLREVLSYNPETGVFVWLQTRAKNFPAGSIAGPTVGPGGYNHVTVDRVAYKAHRLAWFYVHGEWPENDIDHINGIRHDNRICNLRPASRSENSLNSGKRNHKTGATSKYRGICFHKPTKQWMAAFCGKYLGIRRTEEEAHQLYLEHARKVAASFPLPLHPDHKGLSA